jgi:hypothetical protein
MLYSNTGRGGKDGGGQQSTFGTRGRGVASRYEIRLVAGGEDRGLDRGFKASAMKGLAGLALAQREKKKKRRTLDVGRCE